MSYSDMIKKMNKIKEGEGNTSPSLPALTPLTNQQKRNVASNANRQITTVPSLNSVQTLYSPSQIAKEEKDIVNDLQSRGKTVNEINAKLALPNFIADLSSKVDSLSGNSGSPSSTSGFGILSNVINAFTQKDKDKLERAKDLSQYTGEQLSNAYDKIPNQNILQRLNANNSALTTAKQIIQPIKDDTVRQNAYDSLVSNGLLEDFKKAFPTHYQSTLGIDNIDKVIGSNINTYDEKQRISKLTGIPVEDLQNLADSLNRDAKLSATSAIANKLPVLSSIMSVPKNLEGNIEGTAYSLGSLVTGNPIQTDNKAFINKDEASTIRNTVTDKIKNPVGKFAYGTGMSIADTLASQALGGGKLGTVFMGMGAYADSVQQGAEKGLTPSQIQTTALASGAFEYLFEKISWDKIKLIAKGEASKNILANIGTQMLTEGGEEIGTDLANNLVDSLVNGGASEMSQLHDFYVANGMSDKDAQKETMKQFAIQLGMSGLGGAISGGLMGGGASLLNKATTPKVPSLDDFQKPQQEVKPLPVLNNPIAKQQEAKPLPTLNNTNVETPTQNTTPLFLTEDTGLGNTTTDSQEAHTLPVLQNTTQNNNSVNTQNHLIPSLDNVVSTHQSNAQSNNGVLPDNAKGYNKTVVYKSDLPQEVKNALIDNPDIHNKITNKETLAKAEDIINNNDTNTALAEFNRLVDMKKPEAVPLGDMLSSKLNDEGRIDEAVEVVRRLSEKLEESGQFSQAAVITLLRSNPIMAMKYVERQIDTLNTKGREKFGEKWTDFELTESEKQTFSQLKPGDAEGIKNAYGDIFNRIQKQYPSTFKEKLFELRRISMLLNVRTNVRNTVSNAMLMPVRWTADRVSALGQSVANLINPNFNKTQAVIVNKDSRKLAKEAWSTVSEELLGTDKYNDVKGATRDKQVFKGSIATKALDSVTNGAITLVNKAFGTQFDNKSSKIANFNKALGKDINPSILESARNLTYWLLEKGDNVFVKKNFESRMASYISAQKIKSFEDIPADAYTLATQEALKATFKDDTALADMLSNAKKNTGVFGEVIMPFTKTPANLAMRGYDYSIGGYVNVVKSLAKNEVRSQADVTRLMDSISKSIVGTGAIAVGIALAKAGFITGPLSDDKDEAAFQRQQGMLPFAIKIGQNYYSYDWAQPVSIPIILGATIYNSMKDSDTVLNSVLQGGLAATDAWFDLSPLQGVKDIFGGYGTPAENIGNAFLQLPLSFFPAQLGALARTTDTTQRSTFSNGNPLDYVKNSAISKIPGLSQTLPATYDTWGNEVKRSDSTGEAAFAQMLNPGQLGNANISPIDSEISRLFDATGNNAVFPKKADWAYQINGQSIKLSNDQYSAMQQTMGKTAFEVSEELITSDIYGKLSDEQKASVIADIYSFASAKAKSEVLGYDIKNSTDYGKAYAVYSDKGSEGLANFYYLRKVLSGNDGNANKVNAINALNLTDEEKGYYINKFIKVSESASAIQNYYGDAGLYQWYNMNTKADYDGTGSAKSDNMTYQIIKSGMSYEDMVNFASVLFEDSKKATAREKAVAKIQEVQDNLLYYQNLDYIKTNWSKPKEEDTSTNGKLQSLVPTQSTQEYNDLVQHNLEYIRTHWH